MLSVRTVVRTHRWTVRPSTGYRRLSSAASTTPAQETDYQADMSLTEAVRPNFDSKVPLVVRQAMVGSNALENWKTWSYFQEMLDQEALCHVEIGGNYSSSERTEIRVGDYLAYLEFFEERYGRISEQQQPSAQDLIYLAQNDIAPELNHDFDLPSIVNELGEGKLYSVMMWIGPYGCVSPLHYDPLDNAFLQFVGVKKVLMYPPGSHVGAGLEGNQSNTSPINFEKQPLDLVQYPFLEDLPPAVECTLHPGDLLYIPKRWWHQVRTVETSVSINAWWR